MTDADATRPAAIPQPLIRLIGRDAEQAASLARLLDDRVPMLTLTGQLADGIERVCAGAGLRWRAHRLYARTGYAHAGALPRNAAEASAGQRRDIVDLQRVYFANRGVWEAIYSAGPCVGVAHTGDDVDAYLQVLAEFVGELVA